MTTAAQAVDRVRRDHLLAGHREQRNKLATSVDADDTTLQFTYDLGSIKSNARLSIGFEDMGVWEAADGSKTAAAHSAGDIVLVNSIFTPARVFAAVKDEMAALPDAGVWQMKSIDLTYDASVVGYDLAGLTDADVLDIYEVRAKTTGPEDDW